MILRKLRYEKRERDNTKIGKTVYEFTIEMENSTKRDHKKEPIINLSAKINEIKYSAEHLTAEVIR